MKKLYLACGIFIYFLCLEAHASDYDKIVQKMTDLQNANQALVKIIDIGTNDQGTKIQGLKIENVQSNLLPIDKPRFLYVAVHHGNEQLSADLAIKFAQDITKMFKEFSSPYYEALSDSIFFVVPVLNISGFNADSRSEKDKNGRSFDPNRDYPDVCVHNKFFQLKSTKNIADFLVNEKITGAVTGHGYVGTFTYPWGIYTDNTKTLDHNFYSMLGKESTAINGYRTGTHTDVIYPAVGSFEDYSYHEHGIWTMLLELGSSANLAKDSETLIKYFSMLPNERSNQHQHTGNCTQTRDSEDLPSRP